LFSVDGSFIVLDWDELALIVKDGPVFLKKFVNKVSGPTVKVGQVDLRSQFLAMNFFIIEREEGRVNIVDRRRVMYAPPKNGAALDIMLDNIELVRLVGEPPIVEKYVGTLLAPNFLSDSDWLAGWSG
jgi:hypothetical protein